MRLERSPPPPGRCRLVGWTRMPDVVADLQRTVITFSAFALYLLRLRCVRTLHRLTYLHCYDSRCSLRLPRWMAAVRHSLQL